MHLNARGPSEQSRRNEQRGIFAALSFVREARETS
jgi:hypothetical protein